MSQQVTEHASGRVDVGGRLVAADPRLLALQTNAGGELGGILAVPKLAAVARLAQNLGILVSRNVCAANGDDDLDFIVQAKPDGDEIALDVSGWISFKQAASRFGSVPESKPAALLWEADEELNITYMSRQWDALDVVGRSLERVFAMSPSEDGQFPIISALATRQKFEHQLARLHHDDDAEWLLSGVPFANQDGNFKGWRGNAIPKRETKAVSFSRPEAVPPVEQDRRAHMLQSALRSPLERIARYADDLTRHTEGPLLPRYVDYAADIAAASRHLLGLVTDLNDVELVETRNFAIAAESIDLVDLVRRAASLLSIRAADKGVRIEPPHADEIFNARADFGRVMQIIVNLISNAVRYTPTGGVVWVRIEQEADLAAVVVADQGTGIDPKDHDLIFEKFTRLNPDEPEGSGLGLYISRRLARLMGGDLNVDSALGQGARFVLTLPQS